MASRTSTDFLQKFVLPLVAGGDMHVSAPISVEEMQEWQSELGAESEALVSIEEARTKALLEIVASPPHYLLEADELALAGAVHNLLVLAHPDCDGWKMSQSMRSKIIATAQYFSGQDRKSERRGLLQRHGLLHKFFSIGRTDIKVSWWTGSASFLGQRPPTRLTRWSGIRQVEREEWKTGFRDLFQGADVMAVVVAIARRTPLSLLLSTHPGTPHLHWEECVCVLRDPVLARAVSNQAIEEADAFAMAARFSASFEQMLERSPRKEDLLCVATFLLHLHGLLAVGESELSKSPRLANALGQSPQSRGTGAQSLTRGLGAFLALPKAMSMVWPQWSVPPGLSEQGDWEKRWKIHQEQISVGLSEGIVQGLAERIQRHLGVVESLPPSSHDAISTQ